MPERLTGEFLGTFALVFCGTGAIIVNQQTHGSITQAGIALTFGLIVMIMILFFGHISGAHINPAVSIALYIGGKFNGHHAVPYIAAQLGGACLASYLLRLLFPGSALLGATIPRGSDRQSFMLETILSFVLMVVILVSTAKKRNSLLAPAIAIGTTVGLEAWFAGPVCGASMNPARSIAPAIASGHFHALWLYVLGPVIGTIMAVFSFRMIRKVAGL